MRDRAGPGIRSPVDAAALFASVLLGGILLLLSSPRAIAVLWTAFILYLAYNLLSFPGMMMFALLHSAVQGNGDVWFLAIFAGGYTVGCVVAYAVLTRIASELR